MLSIQYYPFGCQNGQQNRQHTSLRILLDSPRSLVPVLSVHAVHFTLQTRSRHRIAQRQDTLATAGARSIWRSRWHVRAGGRSSAYRRRARSTACVSARWRLLTPSSPAPSWCCGRLRAKTTRGLHLGCDGPKLLNRRAYRHCQPTEPDGSHLRGPGWPRPNFSSFSHGKVDPPQHFHRISAHKVI